MKDANCIFCKIVSGEAPCHKVWEDDKHLAFLTLWPNTDGFSVVITKEHHPSYAFNVPDEVFIGLAKAAREVGNKIDAAFPDVGRTGLIMEGMGVDHLHAKLFPMHGVTKDGQFVKHEADMDKFFEVYEGYISTWNGPRASDEELKKIAEKISRVN